MTRPTTTTRLPATLRTALCVTAWATFGMGCELSTTSDTDDGPSLHELRLESLLEEGEATELFGERGATHRQLLELLSDTQTSETARGLFLRVGSLGGGWGRASDVIDALAELRASGKPIHCHTDQTDNLGFVLMATSCDHITLSPSGMLNLVGVSAHLVHARRLLETLGLTAEMLHVGKYKGAADMLTEDAVTPAAKETWDALLDALDAQIRAAVGKRMKTADADAIAAVIDRGPFMATEARALGLIDDIQYDDGARAHAKAAAQAQHVTRIRVGPDLTHIGIAEVIKTLMRGASSAPTEPHLSLVTLTGTIQDGRGDGNPSAAADPFVRRMRRLGDDPNVAAVLLRIDSPGGSAPASDRMWHAVARVQKRKPVVVSVGDMAASGGYYIASAATAIFAQPRSLVGSIGVVGGKIVAADLAERSGINVHVLQRGQNAAWMSLVRRLAPTERDALSRLLQGTYDLFLDRVQAGRRLPLERVQAAAEGRVMDGTRGQQAGLIDQLGGFRQALAEARRLGKLSAEAPIDVWPPQQGLLQQLGQAMGAPMDAHVRSSWQSMLPAEARVPVVESLLLNGDRVSTVLPYGLTIQ